MPTIFDVLVLAKTEATKGTDAAPTAAADAVRVLNRPWPKIDGKPIDRQVVKQTMGNLPHLMNPDASVQVEIQCELKGSGTAGTPPEIEPLLLACRHVATVTAGTSVLYLPATATEHSATIYIYADGLLWKMVGAVGTAKIEAQIGQPTKITFTMSAPYIAPAAAAIPAGAVFDATQPIVFNSADVVTEGGTSIRVGQFGLDFGNDVQEHTRVGYHQFVVANRSPELTINKHSVSTAADWAGLVSAQSVAMHAQIGAAAGNIVTIDAGNAVRKTVGYGEEAEAITHDVTFGLYETASDDQYTITFS